MSSVTCEVDFLFSINEKNKQATKQILETAKRIE